MATISPASLLDQLRWRYATKQFDATRKIPADVWAAIEQSLVLTPSSYGLQPWKFLVIDDPALRAKLKAVSWNQGQVTDASHHLVFLAKDQITEADVSRLIQATASTRGVPADALAGYAGMMISDLVKGPRSQVIKEWAARQAYIALGQFMASCALLGIDACPLEGLDPVKYDEILGLAGSGYHTVCACPAGYRAAGDKYAALAKIRYPAESIISHR